MIEPARYRRVLLDTGPLVAIRNPADSLHELCCKTLQRIEPPLITTWAVLTEAAWMLRGDTEVVGRMLRGAAGGMFVIAGLTTADLLEIDGLRRRYRNLAPQLADLTLLHLASRDNYEVVFTLDRRDFTVFRLPGKRALILLPEES